MPHSPMPSVLLEHCRELRKNTTTAEEVLWSLLRDRRLDGFKFRRQVPIKSYILDFYCYEKRLAIELDGSGHLTSTQHQYDTKRDGVLAKENIRVLRLWNSDVLNHTTAALETIWAALHDL